MSYLEFGIPAQPRRSGRFFTRNINNLKYTIMKDLLKTYEKDIMKDGFTVIEMLTFGIIVPGLFIALLVLWSMIQEWACR